MSKVWDYFKKEAGIAYCKNCEYKIDHGPGAPTTTLSTHLKYQHPILYKELKAKVEAAEKAKNQKPQTGILKRLFSQSVQGTSNNIETERADEEGEEILAKKAKESQQDVAQLLGAKSIFNMVFLN
jgi:hypothetical protein